jgi:hypothetical protein
LPGRTGSIIVKLGQRRIPAHVRNTTAFLFILCVVGFASDTTPSPSTSVQGAAKTTLPDIVFVQTANFSVGTPSRRFPEGSRIVRLSSRSAHTLPVDLTPELFAAADPQVDFGGTKILFSGQKVRGDRWQIWEMDADGAHKRQITQCTEDCLRPGYLPEGEIVFTVLGRVNGSPESYLAATNMDGTTVHRITFSSADWWFETVLRDGRILASASWPLSAAARNSGQRLLYTLRPDGTAMDSLRCDHQPSAQRGEAEELEGGSILFVMAQGHPVESGGQLVEIPQGALHEQKITAAIGEYLSPRQVSENQLIVARRPLQTSGAHQRFALYSFDLQKKLIGPAIYSDATLSSIQPVALASHPVPRKFWSTINPDSKIGYFISLDSYSSTDAPKDRVSTPIARVRAVALQPGGNQERVLGEAPVEKDGSFYVEVPADQPVRFELLDANGKLILAEKSWIWARPGEQRGCAGCHSDKALAPENHWPLTLKRFDTPTHLDQNENTSTAKAN